MKVSFSNGLDDGREFNSDRPGHCDHPLAGGRRSREPKTSERRRSARCREAAEYDADAIVDVRFEVDALKGVDIEAVALKRVSGDRPRGPVRQAAGA